MAPRAAVERPAELPSRLRFRNSSIALSLAVAIALVALQTVSLWTRRIETLTAARTRAGGLALILAEHMRRRGEAADAALRQMALFSVRAGGPSAPAALWDPVLRSAAAGMTAVGSLTVTDSAGVIRHSTSRAAIVGQSRRDRVIFTRLASGADTGLVVDTPFRNYVDGRMMLPLGRALRGPDGSFQGIVVATLIPAELRDFYQAVHPGGGGLIWVLHPEGVVLVREPSVRDPIGQGAGRLSLLRAGRDRAAGVLSGPLEPGGPEYVSAWRTLTSPPLIFAVSLRLSHELATWRRDALLSAALTALVVLALAIASWRLARQIEAGAAGARTLVQRDQELVEVQRVARLGSARVAPRGTELRPSPQLAAMLDLPRDPAELPLDTLLERLNEANRARLREAIGNCLASGSRAQLEVRARLADGAERRFWTEVVAEPAGGSLGTGALAIFQDVTDQRIAEERASQSQRMAAIGRLTGGVAHDFNNLLTVIFWSVEALKESASRLGAEATASLEHIRTAADRAAALTRRLLAFSRRQALAPRAVDLNELVRSTHEMLPPLLGETVSVRLALAETGCIVVADPVQVETALMNLCLNARDAMPGGGLLLIETATGVLDEEYARRNADAVPGTYGVLSVGDTGMGIPREQLAMVFEPFFTTKEVGKGTGLGLSMVYGFVRQSGGHVKLYSEPGVGTTVKLYLPAAPANAKVEARRLAPPRPERGRGETILLVEDELSLRELTGGMLAELGYRVLEAPDGPDALAVLRREPRIDLLFTDMVLPGGLGGRELALRARRLRPELRVLFASGYAPELVAPGGPAVPADFLLSKPYRLEEVARAVASALARAPAELVEV
ncbi:MAG TPA: ATP-binding protein [Gemmatimonadales bacterium]|jgi:signal transduction histidine kinase/CheY-like chemotaxis protein|nr:ATP-binding protein [Gemmatimonadales bacterium]